MCVQQFSTIEVVSIDDRDVDPSKTLCLLNFCTSEGRSEPIE